MRLHRLNMRKTIRQFEVMLYADMMCVRQTVSQWGFVALTFTITLILKTKYLMFSGGSKGTIEEKWVKV